MRRLRQSKGFTLIELLVVIVIISILASLLLANFVGVRQRGRDAQRKSDLRQIQSALELYRADVGAYPTTISECTNSLSSGATVYMKKIPCDSLQKTTSYPYTSDGSTYTIIACLENANDSDSDASLGNTPAIQSNCSADPTNTGVSFTLTNP